MTTAVELLKQGRRDEFWQRYCGFLDLGIEEYMAIQERLLLEQLQLLADCELGRKLFGGNVPRTVSEFRRVAPITVYRDYVPYLAEQREEMLPVKPVAWARTSGSTGDYAVKWCPVTPHYHSKFTRDLYAVFAMAGASYKGDLVLEAGDTLLYAAAPPPYATGLATRALDEDGLFRSVPPVAQAETMTFQERVQQGFLRSMGSGIGYFGGLASVLMKMGERFSSGSQKLSLSPAMLQPSTLYRLGRMFLVNKMSGTGILPKDIWRPKGILATGMDVQAYAQRIKALWGRAPLEAYACTEFGTLACQAWDENRSGLTLIPDAGFWEFMPVPDYHLWRADPTYKPALVPLAAVQPGEYVLTVTSLGGGPFVRYVIGDLIRVIALEDESLGIALPQIRVESRADSTINLGSMVVLTERAIWNALTLLDLGLTNWTARKEYDLTRKDPVLHLYIENTHLGPERFRADLNDALIETHEEYASFHGIMEVNPLRVTALAPGTYDKYLESKQAEGADLGHLKPPRMEPSEQVLARLVAISAGSDRGPR